MQLMISKISSFFKFSQNSVDGKIALWLCIMHYFWGFASAMIFTLLPIFIIDELKGSYKSFGLLEGTVIFLSFISKLLFGFLIDIFKKKKSMLFTGICLTALSKVSLACSFNILFVFIAKSLDRFAKGLRQAPSDAILAEISTAKGFAYSVRYTMNISGNLTGSVLTSLIVKLLGCNFRLIFTLAIIPTIIALYIYNNKIKINYKEEKNNKLSQKHKWNIKDISKLPKSYWSFIIMVSILMFARFSEGFLTLRAKEVLPNNIASFPLFMAMYEICAAIIAIPIGKISDKIDKKLIFLGGTFIFLIAHLTALFACGTLSMVLVYILVGIHMGSTHGLLSSVIAKSAPKSLIGTAFAIYYGIDAIALFCSNYIAGESSKFAQVLGLQGSAGPFIAGSLATVGVMGYILYLIAKSKNNKEAVF
ncbi:MAG: MFS transporter [Holosporales bacterium]|jgi:MFS family permease|nr:MFS transporter [Holosporales bacterium]